MYIIIITNELYNSGARGGGGGGRGGEELGNGF